MKLNTLQRLMLSSQLRILEALDPERAPELARRRAALEGGFALEYDWVARELEPELAEAECLAVRQALEMFAALRRVDVAPLDEKTRAALRFDGFDAQHERSYVRYARFLAAECGFAPAAALDTFES